MFLRESLCKLGLASCTLCWFYKLQQLKYIGNWLIMCILCAIKTQFMLQFVPLYIFGTSSTSHPMNRLKSQSTIYCHFRAYQVMPNWRQRIGPLLVKCDIIQSGQLVFLTNTAASFYSQILKSFSYTVAIRCRKQNYYFLQPVCQNGINRVTAN